MDMKTIWCFLCVALTTVIGVAEGQSSCVVANDCTGSCTNDKTHMSCINHHCQCRSHDQSPFTYHTSELTYEAAKDACLRVDTQLVKINTSAKYNLLQHFLNAQHKLSDLWIGLHVDASKLPSHVYRNIDGTTEKFFVWDRKDGEPNYHSSQQCIRLEKSNKQMRTTPCSAKHSFVCERVAKLGCVAKTDCKYRCTGIAEFHCVDFDCKCGPIV